MIMSPSTSSIFGDSVSVSDFYVDRSVFVTGGTGFMGKVLVEKLLRSCPGIKNIYLLMRPKRGQDVNTRLQELTSSPLFERLRSESSCALEKIVPILGDITEPALGISPSDQELLAKTVSVVFHSAATVKFDEALKLSVTINILGTKRLVQLCHTMNNLEALIHVSTAYCNCDRVEVNEEIYPAPYDPEHIIQAMEWMDDELVQSLTPKLIGNRPNTYTFTKALTEQMLLKESGVLPVAIVRPSIVISSISEPVAGWVDNWNGPTGIVAAVGKGFFRTMYCHPNKVADLVPVDLVINLMISAAWRTAATRPNEIVVYNCSTGQNSPITWKEFVSSFIDALRLNPLSDLMWYPIGKIRSSFFLNQLNIYLLHYLPAYTIDAFSWIIGKKPIMVKNQKKLDKATACLHYFTTREWQFVGENTLSLYSSLSPEDKKVFPFDMRQIDWTSYIQSYTLGIRQFIFKDPLSTLEKSKREIKRWFILHRLTQILCVILVWRFLLKKSSFARKYWYQFINLVLRLVRLLPIP